MPAREELPSTLRRSPKKAQETFIKAHDSAVETYGEGQRAHRVAYAAVKHLFERVGDHWEPKPRPGPSDQQAQVSRRDHPAETARGVNAHASKSHLLDIAKKLGIEGRYNMTKPQLVDAIQKANERSRREATRR
jgi:cation transport regulator ChaB